MVSLEIGKVYTFHTNASAVLGAIIKNAKLQAIINYDIALKYDNIVNKYRTIYPLLPVGTPDSPESCVYYVFKTEAGDTVVFADQWIDLNTVELVEHIVISVTVNEASLSDVTNIRNALNALGFTNYVIKTS